MEEQELIIDKINDLKEYMNKRMDDFCERNDNQHRTMIERQDHTNGSLGELRKSQIILRTVLMTLGLTVLAGLTALDIFNPEFRGMVLKIIMSL